MEDLDYDSKFAEMQKYVPFLERVIEKLKNNDQDNPRKAQLEKMQTLHGLLNNKQKKLKIETLLKCESVLKKLHAKIEKSDDLGPPKTLKIPSITTTTTNPFSATSNTTNSTSNTTNKFVPNRNLIEIHTCPASPTQLGEEDFHPPVEIPTERRTSPVRLPPSQHWEPNNQNKFLDESKKTYAIPTITRFSNPSSFHQNSNTYPQQQHPSVQSSRWSDYRDERTEMTPVIQSPTASQNRSWLIAPTSAPSTMYRSQPPQPARTEPTSKFSSEEEENWDEPETEPLPKATPVIQIPPSTQISGREPHNSGREPYNSGREPHNSGREPHNSGREPHNSGRDTHSSSRDSHNSVREPHSSGRESRSSGREQRNRGGESRSGGRASHSNSRERHSSSREPRTSSREPLTSSREPRISSREPRTNSRESHTPGRELHTSGRESHTSGRESNTSGRESHTSSRESHTSARESHTSGRESNNSYPHRHHEKNFNHDRDLPPHLPPPFPPLPDITLNKDAMQKKLYHDTIYKYKKTDSGLLTPYMNPPPPETPSPINSSSNIFNRLGEKVDNSFENFRIEVKNDMMKAKVPKALHPPLPPLIPIKPIDEVLKSPPLSADDIDDLLNESLEAALGKQTKPKSNESETEKTTSSLDAVRKKLAMISKPHSPQLDSPTRTVIDEPFYRRGHTPTKNSTAQIGHSKSRPQSPQDEDFRPIISSVRNGTDLIPTAPSNPMDNVIERLALKYHPHRRQSSMSNQTNETSNFRMQSDVSNINQQFNKEPIMDPNADRLALKYNPHPRREGTTTPIRTHDPRVGKIMGPNSPHITSPVAVSPVPNILPSLNQFDPRLRSTRLPSVDLIPSSQFCTSNPFSSSIPSLMDMKVKNPLPVTCTPPSKTPFGSPPAPRIDPRMQRQSAIYAEKFNPERNDQTERMKYLESKRKKPPEPKTYGEYRQSKSRQQPTEELPKVDQVNLTPPHISTQPVMPSTLDKMYRNADYGKEMGGSIQGFKIPKKVKPEEVKVDQKKDDKDVCDKDNLKKDSTKDTPKQLNETKNKTAEDKPEVLVKPTELTEEPLKEIDLFERETVKKPNKKVDKKEKDKQTENKKTIKENKESPKENSKEDPPLENKSKEPVMSVEVEIELKTKVDTAKEPEPLKESVSEEIVVKDDLGISPGARVTRRRRCKSVITDETPSLELKKSPKIKDLTTPEPKEISFPKPKKNEKTKPETKKVEVKPTVKVEQEDEKMDEEENEESKETELKPRRIATRRSTILKENPKQIEVRESESPVPSISQERCRSASDIFSPTTDNSVVSTQNIISGKRRTRASINFNEKATKKPATPKTATPVVASPCTPPKTRGKPGPKPGAKKGTPKSTQNQKSTDEKQASDDGQICAVSSTTSQGGEAEVPKTENFIATDKSLSPEEPSSSGLKPQTPSADVDENQKKQEWLEGFLKSIVDPTTNKDRIMDMLKSVLDDKKLQQVKEIMYSSEEDETKESSTKAKGQPETTSKPRATRTKKNELDRLNEDIRDMFICQGVVTATGRRMCTLAKETTKEKTPQPKEPPKEKKPKASVSPPVVKRKMRKAKVIISPLNMRALRSRKVGRPRKMPVLEPNTPIKLPNESDDSIEDDSMQSEEEEEEISKEEAPKPLKKKPGPKSKCVTPLSLLSSSDDEDDIQLAHLKDKIRNADAKRAEELQTETKKIETKKVETKKVETKKIETKKAENKKAENKSETTKASLKEAHKEYELKEGEPMEVAIEDKPQSELDNQNDSNANESEVQKKEEHKSELKKDEDTVPKNTNAEWHAMSDYAQCCVICKEKARFIAPHYCTAHNDSEVYTSRLPQAVFEEIKLNIGNQALYAVPKKNLTCYHYRCPFCNFQATCAIRGWMEHFTIHTGEYNYKCSKCFKSMNSSTHMQEHMKKYCPDAKKIIREPIIRGHGISGYACDLCNFIQMLRVGIVRHRKLHHGLDDAASNEGIIEVKLLQTAGVCKMEEDTKEKSSCLPPPLNIDVSPVVAEIPQQTQSTPLKSPVPINTNMEVFLSRELASPTSDILTERLKSIDHEEEMASDTNVNAVSPFKDTPAATRMTIAEKLSQRFKNIDKQNLLEDTRTADVEKEKEREMEKEKEKEQEKEIEKEKEKEKEIGEEKETEPMQQEENIPQTLPPIEVVETPVEVAVEPEVDPLAIGDDEMESFNESGQLIIDEQDNISADEDGSESGNDRDIEGNSEKEIENENDEEDDNENWEDIEITETKGGLQKDKNKNKSIFQTLSRLYASIAPKKTSKKTKEKEKEKKKADPLPPAIRQVSPTINSASVPATVTSPFSTIAQEPILPPRIPNLSDFLPDSQSDSLDMLLSTTNSNIPATENSSSLPASSSSVPHFANDFVDMVLSTNYDWLEGDGTSFPHLDLNDLDSPNFLLTEEQTNIQDAIAMATDMDTPRFDVLGHALPSSTSKPQQQQGTSSSNVNTVGNFGFSLSGRSLKYYCMVKACTFLFSDHPDGLQNHFLLEHPSLKWDGYCQTCKAQVSSFGGREMQHMLDVHSKLAEPTSEKPRIKFRRLTGDILSTEKPQPQLDPLPMASPIPSTQINSLSLATMLQSEPKAMIPPQAPPAFETDIPLYKNVSKEFTITNVSEGVTDNDLMNLVLNQSESSPGGIQISQVISLNAGGKSLSPSPLTQIPDLLPFQPSRSSPSLGEFQPTFPAIESQSQRSSPLPLQRNSPIPSQIRPTIKLNLIRPMSQRNSPVPSNPIPKQNAFVCCALHCSFSTDNRSAMNEHLKLHLQGNPDRNTLKCHICHFTAPSVPEYFQHLAQVHSKSEAIAPTCPSAKDLTQKIQNILRASSNSGNTNEEQEKEGSEQETENSNQEIEPLNFAKRLRQAAEESVAETGLPDSEVWKCILYPECVAVVTEIDFQTHLTTHMHHNPSSFPSLSPGSSLHCPHCTVNYYRPAILKAHIKTHARHQYFCYLCSCTTFANFNQAQKHFNDAHSRSTILHTQPLIANDDECKLLIVSETKLNIFELNQFGEKLIADWERKKALNKTHFKPNEQYLLPLQPIFNNQVFCSVCNYKTKVRTNMFRHLQLHKQEVDVGSVDPVNPVPCLEKNVKHFDKMLNLACSSNAAGAAKPKESVKIPMYVPDMKRFVCGHPGCKYLTITDQMLRSHLNALHGSEKGYQCPHCQEDICKKNMCAERIVQHLKFHGSKIYQCGECEYLHYTKHVVERHVHEKHSSVSFVSLITLDRNDVEVNKTTQLVAGRNLNPGSSTTGEGDTSESPSALSTSTSSKFKWECALCKHQTVTWNQMISHANAMHGAKHQYNCVHCTFGSAHLAHIMDHIDSKHPTKTREAKYVFYKINETTQDKAADTRPLWTRDDPKRVRSIRGILMENEEDAERTKQSLSKAGVDLDDEDEDVEIVQVIESESSMKPGGLGCFHCKFTCKEMNALSAHWKTKHWLPGNNELVQRIPFFFRIHTILKCPLCAFVGDHVSIRTHLTNNHNEHAFCAADPILPNTCGHCPFIFSPNRLEVLIRHYVREHKPTDVKNLSSSLLRSLLALGECQVYMQCYFCAEICADKSTIIEHQREFHKNSNFRYKQIKDEVIYRCGMCQYSSTNELATLRHMIDHFDGFNTCHFCGSAQTSFNTYMQHCYSTHSKELTGFKDIYSFKKITAFLGQMLLIFPNGLIVTKKNLVHTQYGSTEKISAMYNEICKKALEPPIPPLCMGRLLAKKSIEASNRPLLPPPPIPVTAKRIAKRRSTVASNTGDSGLTDFLIPSGPQKIKKRKMSICEDRPAPLFSTIISRPSAEEEPATTYTCVSPKQTDSVGFSFYGKQRDPVDLSKIYTQIAIGDKYAPVSVKKFALLFKMNAKVVVEKMNFESHRPQKRIGVFNKPCPASKKKRLEV